MSSASAATRPSCVNRGVHLHVAVAVKVHDHGHDHDHVHDDTVASQTHKDATWTNARKLRAVFSNRVAIARKPIEMIGP